MVENVFNNTNEFYAFEEFKTISRALLKDNTELAITDFGAGSKKLNARKRKEQEHEKELTEKRAHEQEAEAITHNDLLVPQGSLNPDTETNESYTNQKERLLPAQPITNVDKNVIELPSESDEDNLQKPKPTN